MNENGGEREKLHGASVRTIRATSTEKETS
jgi:hypothetical protein